MPLDLAPLALAAAALLSALTLAPASHAQGLPATGASSPAEAVTTTAAPGAALSPARAASAVKLASSAAPGTNTSSLLSPSWASLTPAQKECLAPLQPEWDRLDSALKGKWLEIAARYPKLSQEHQQRLRERMVAWTRMTPAERQKARIGYQHAGELRSEEQASRLQAKWEAYQALSPESRQRLAERAAEKASGHRPGKDDKALQADAAPGKTAASLLVPAPSAGLPPPLTLSNSGPTVMLARPGATTVLLTQRPPSALTRATALGGPVGAALGGTVRPLRSPREGHLNPQTLLPQPAASRQADESSR